MTDTSLKTQQDHKPKPDKAPSERAWQRMLSGRRLDLLNPSPLDIEIEDIAHGLARLARWNGQTTGPHAFSVAQHCLIVEDIASSQNKDWPNQWRLAALLHDAPEYVIGDLISPFKSAIGLDYKQLENQLLSAIHIRFGLPSNLPDLISQKIKSADKIAAFYEATRLAGFSDKEARQCFGSPGSLPQNCKATLLNLRPLPISNAQTDFIARFQDLLPPA